MRLVKTRRELLLALKNLGLWTLIPACKGQSDSEDSLKDLTSRQTPTVVTQDRIRQVVEKYQMTKWVQQGNQQETVFKNLAVVPDSYLKFLFDRQKAGRFRIFFGDCNFKRGKFGKSFKAAGICRYDQVGAYEIELRLAQSATIHEVGHGVEFHAHKLKGINNSTTIRESTFASVLKSAEASRMRSYSKINSKELWADGFSSFYRSPESRAVIKKSMPKTWAYLSKILEPPVNLTESERSGDFANADRQNRLQEDSGEIAEDAPSSSSGLATKSMQDICSATTQDLEVLLCLLAKGFSSGAFGMVAGQSMILPVPQQVLSVFESSMILTELDMTPSQASKVEIWLDRTKIGEGLQPFPYGQSDRQFSALFKIPPQLTLPQGVQEHWLSLVYGNNVIVQQNVVSSRTSYCGDVQDFAG